MGNYPPIMDKFIHSVDISFFFKLQIQPQFQSQIVTLAAFRGQRHGLRLKLSLNSNLKHSQIKRSS